MKLHAVIAAFALSTLSSLSGCYSAFGYHEVATTSYTKLPQSKSELVLDGSTTEVEQRIVEKMTNRGFPLVDRRTTSAGVWLKFSGNRDFSGASTLGSAFYAWVDSVGVMKTRLRMVGKPMVDHREGCPAMDGAPCTPLETFVQWGVSGAEEATAIHGVYAELAVDGVVSQAPAK
jgi:hypothetical protein